MSLLSGVGGGLRRFFIPIGVRASSEMTLINRMTDDDLENKYESLFDQTGIDGWQIRKAMNDLHGMDMVPSPVIIKSALKACRKINDFALAIRFMEAVRFKCGNKKKQIWPYIMQEIEPTLEELGIGTIEDLGYDKPELHLPCFFYQ